MKLTNCKLKNATCKLQIVIACVLAMLSACDASTAPFSFDDIEFWVGTGPNQAALVVDWVDDVADPPALAWGYRWEGVAKGRDMLTAVVAADPRLFAKLGGSAASPNAVYGLGYDADDDGVFGIDDGTVFDATGIAVSGPADLAVATDPGDYYAEGWFTGFWHYGIAGSNPYDGGTWADAPSGIAGRDLADGSWDSWVFTPTFDFSAFAENPTAAPSPFAPGDFNFDGEVDANDYDVWRSAFGSTTQLAADANRNGTVDAADYVVWRKNLNAPTGQSILAVTLVPEPHALTLAVGVVAATLLGARVRRNAIQCCSAHSFSCTSIWRRC